MGISEFFTERQNRKSLKKLNKIADLVDALEEDFKKLSDDELKAMTPKLKERLANGETLDDILPEAFATVREAADRVLGMRHYRVQIIGGIALHQGHIAEMQTGEGKTLVATLPAYLNALAGKGVHIVTVNDYLARRDASWMGSVYKFLGLSVGVIYQYMPGEDKEQAYLADITYATNNEIGFDYLRDNLRFAKKHLVQRGHFYAIVDEVDSILIDEARSPLIISETQPGVDKLAIEVNRFIIRKIKPGYYAENEDGEKVLETLYDMDEKETSISLNDEGTKLAEEHFKDIDFADLEGAELLSKINNALRAHYIMHLDEDYIIENGEIVIIDQNTGRKMPGRRYSEGLHEAIEAKEGLNVRSGSKTVATTTFQNYFRIYEKLSGMTGTAMTEAAEFKGIYNLDVISIPPNLPSKRKDEPDKIFTTKELKFEAVIEDILDCVNRGQPVLVGTANIDTSEYLSKLLTRKRIAHNVLNAKQHEKEAQIIAQAGSLGAVTISTNMAGRGTDIVLGGNPDFPAREQMKIENYTDDEIEAATIHTDTKTPEEERARKRYLELVEMYSVEAKKNKEKVIEAGGLRVIGTERHESRRIDNQLRGRAGRQGDVGSSCYYVSVEDDLFRKFGGEGVTNLLSHLIGGLEGGVIQFSTLSKQLDKAQKRSEENNYAIRKQILNFDDVINKQRELIYAERAEILDGEDVHAQVIKYIEVLVEKIVTENLDFSEVDELTIDYISLNTKFLRHLFHHSPTEEEIELALKAKDPFDLVESILNDDKSYLEQMSKADADLVLEEDEDDSDNVYIQEIEGPNGEIIEIDVTKLFINPKVCKKRNIHYVIEIVYHMALIQYAKRIKAYNEKVEKHNIEKPSDFVMDAQNRTISGSSYQEAMKVLKAEIADSIEKPSFQEIEQQVLLSIVNKYWMDHIDKMDALKKGIFLRGYAQHDPILEYRREATIMFDEMVYNIQIFTAYNMLKNNNLEKYVEHEDERVHKIASSFTFVKNANKKEQKIGRNAPCPCGSGRKYKNCCGKNG